MVLFINILVKNLKLSKLLKSLKKNNINFNKKMSLKLIFFYYKLIKMTQLNLQQKLETSLLG